MNSINFYGYGLFKKEPYDTHDYDKGAVLSLDEVLDFWEKHPYSLAALSVCTPITPFNT